MPPFGIPCPEGLLKGGHLHASVSPPGSVCPLYAVIQVSEAPPHKTKTTRVSPFIEENGGPCQRLKTEVLDPHQFTTNSQKTQKCAQSRDTRVPCMCLLRPKSAHAAIAHSPLSGGICRNMYRFKENPKAFHYKLMALRKVYAP